MTATELRTQADAIEDTTATMAEMPEIEAAWHLADRLRAQADDLEANAIDWRSSVLALLSQAVEITLPNNPMQLRLF